MGPNRATPIDKEDSVIRMFIRQRPAARLRRVAMVFQSFALYPHKTVLDNIVFPLKALQLDRAERERKAARGSRTAQHPSLAQPPPATALRR